MRVRAFLDAKIIVSKTLRIGFLDSPSQIRTFCHSVVPSLCSRRQKEHVVGEIRPPAPVPSRSGSSGLGQSSTTSSLTRLHAPTMSTALVVTTFMSIVLLCAHRLPTSSHRTVGIFALDNQFPTVRAPLTRCSCGSICSPLASSKKWAKVRQPIGQDQDMLTDPQRPFRWLSQTPKRPYSPT